MYEWFDHRHSETDKAPKPDAATTITALHYGNSGTMDRSGPGLIMMEQRLAAAIRP
jgi:hypothetical protein